jgi:uncharacterized membrane protein YccC
MRLSSRRTWSQQQLASKLLLVRERSPRLLSWEHRRLLIHAARTALAAALCWWLAVSFGFNDGYWGAITAIIVSQSNFGATITASRDRLLGTLLGAVLGFSFSLVGTLPWNFIFAVITALVVCGLTGMRSSSRLAGVTICVVMLVRSGSHWTLALHRVFEVFLGIVIAVVFSTLVFPDRARLRLRDGLSQEFLTLGSFFEAILEGYCGQPAERAQGIRNQIFALMRANNLLAEAARNEPSGGPGWREGLGMVAQYGRTLFDAMIALELAVKDSTEDAYAQQMEETMAHLAVDIHNGFHWVASCIHNWRFDVLPPGLHLENDIVQLEARMNEVRHTGVQYSQAEILRAYAVQLHLKQIARTLRASRVETSRAIGEALRQNRAASLFHRKSDVAPDDGSNDDSASD